MYCVKEERNTPNVQGSEKVVEKVVKIKKNNRKLLLLKAKCASCGITKTSFLPTRSEGSGIDIHAVIGKFPKPKKVGDCRDIISQGHTILLKSR